MPSLEELSKNAPFQDGLASVALLVLVVLLRSGAARWIEAAELPPFRRRNLLIISRNIAIVAFLGGLVGSCSRSPCRWRPSPSRS
jgi:hypothetical protein